MKPSEELFDIWTNKQREEYQDCLGQIKELLVPHEYYDMSEITKKLLVVDQSVLFSYLGNHVDGLKNNRFDCPFNPYDRVQFVSDFVGYYLLDDGCPGIAYAMEHTLCAARDKHPRYPDIIKPEPIICRDVEILRETFPRASFLSAKKALTILKYHERQQEKYNKFNKAEEDESSNLDEMGEWGAKQKARIALENRERALYEQLLAELVAPLTP